MKKLSTSSALALIGAIGLGLCTTPATADAIADFYKGKRIKMIVGSSPGEGYATYAHLISRHMGRYIPGKPRTVLGRDVPRHQRTLRVRPVQRSTS